MAKKVTEVEQFTSAVDTLAKAFPHLTAWLADEESVRRFLVKLKDDGTFLAVAAGYGPDGGPVVCFGVGYGPLGAVFGIDRAIQGGNWKVDKFYDDKGK